MSGLRTVFQGSSGLQKVFLLDFGSFPITIGLVFLGIGFGLINWTLDNWKTKIIGKPLKVKSKITRIYYDSIYHFYSKASAGNLGETVKIIVIIRKKASESLLELS